MMMMMMMMMMNFFRHESLKLEYRFFDQKIFTQFFFFFFTFNNGRGAKICCITENSDKKS